MRRGRRRAPKAFGRQHAAGDAATRSAESRANKGPADSASTCREDEGNRALARDRMGAREERRRTAPWCDRAEAVPAARRRTRRFFLLFFLPAERIACFGGTLGRSWSERKRRRRSSKNVPPSSDGLSSSRRRTGWTRSRQASTPRRSHEDRTTTSLQWGGLWPLTCPGPEKSTIYTS